MLESPARVRCDRVARELREGLIGVLKEIRRRRRCRLPSSGCAFASISGPRSRGFDRGLPRLPTENTNLSERLSFFALFYFVV